MDAINPSPALPPKKSHNTQKFKNEKLIDFICLRNHRLLSLFCEFCSELCPSLMTYIHLLVIPLK